jgi:hypothetical protein
VRNSLYRGHLRAMRFKLRTHYLIRVSLLHRQVALPVAKDSELFDVLVGTNYGKKSFEGRRRASLDRECNAKSEGGRSIFPVGFAYPASLRRRASRSSAVQPVAAV